MLMAGTLQKRVLVKFVRRLADGATSKIEFRVSYYAFSYAER